MGTLVRGRSVVPSFTLQHSDFLVANGDLGGLAFVDFSKTALTERSSLEEPRAPITRLQARSRHSEALLDAGLVWCVFGLSAKKCSSALLTCGGTTPRSSCPRSSQELNGHFSFLFFF